LQESKGKKFNNLPPPPQKKNKVPWNETIRGPFKGAHSAVSNPGRCAAVKVYIILFKTTAK